MNWEVWFISQTQIGTSSMFNADVLGFFLRESTEFHFKSKVKPHYE